MPHVKEPCPKELRKNLEMIQEIIAQWDNYPIPYQCQDNEVLKKVHVDALESLLECRVVTISAISKYAESVIYIENLVKD